MCMYIPRGSVVPGRVYHAELEGDLMPRPMASNDELIAVLTFDDGAGDCDDKHREILEVYHAEINRNYARMTDAASIRLRYIPNLEAQRLEPRIPIVLDDGKFKRGNNVIDQHSRALWLTLQRTGSLTETAKAHGLNISTCRLRLMAYKDKIARSAGINPRPPGKNRYGRLIPGTSGRKRRAEGSHVAPPASLPKAA